MNILVSGGAGYIGSHTCVSLLNAGHNVIIADNLSNCQEESVHRIERITGKSLTFYNADVTKEDELTLIFENNAIDGVVHFAGYKAVGESVLEPIKYYYNNVVSTIQLSSFCKKFSVRNFVFSSSATVYEGNRVPYKESMKLGHAANPYGETKIISERILTDLAKSDSNISVSILRYFNPIGAHPSGLIGESPSGIPNNLMPYITQVAKGKLERLYVYGDDYPTPDGTGVRDYLHVMDLSEGHVAALEKLKTGTHIYNLGRGQGTSVIQLITTFENATGNKIPYSIVERRPGDVATSYADVDKAKKELDWNASRSLWQMCEDAWRFESMST